MLLFLLQKDMISQNKLFISCFTIPKKRCHVFLHLNKENDFFPHHERNNKILRNHEIQGCLVWYPFPQSCNGIWDSSSTCLEKYLPVLYPEEYSPLKSPQILDPSSITQKITYIIKFSLLILASSHLSLNFNNLWLDLTYNTFHTLPLTKLF